MNLHQTIQTNFKQNIEYFQTQHPQLFQKLSEYDSAVVNGYYAEKYELVYEDDMFDVVEKESAKTLYNNSLSNYTQDAANSISYLSTENSFATFSPKADEKIVQGTMKSIEKFIFFGTGLGTHINSIDEKIDAHIYLIVEDDLELFRLSLFVTNYKKLSHGKKLYFSIFEEQEEFKKTAQEFLEYKYYLNYYIKFFHMLHHKEDKITNFHLLIGTQAHNTYLYTTMLEQMLKSLPIIQSDYNYLHKEINLKDDKLNQKPYLLIASGPSLENNLSWLQKNHKAFTLVAVSSSLSFLEKHSIDVDIIISLDGFERNKVVFERIKDINFFKDAICIFSDKMNQSTLELFDKKNIFLFEVNTHYKKDVLRPVAPCVGSLSYQLLLLFGVKEIYLLGLDMAIDSKSGQTHTSTHVAGKVLDKTDKIELNDTLTYKQTLLNVAGNMQTTVLTTPYFASTIEAINLSTHYFKKENQQVYNLSNGAKFKDIPAKSTSELLLETKETISESLHKTFLAYSINGFTDEERKMLSSKISSARKLQTKIESSLNKLEKLPSLLDTTQDIDKILDTYLHKKLAYIFHLKNVKEETLHQHLQTAQDMLKEEIFTIIQTYIETLKKVT